MIAAFKKKESSSVNESLAARSALKLARASHASNPVTSPARELQLSLSQGLNAPKNPRSGMTLSVFFGIFGSALITGLLFYAAA